MMLKFYTIILPMVGAMACAIYILRPRWLFAMFAWQGFKDTGEWLYQENTLTGERRATRIRAGQQLLNRGWLDGGEFYPPCITHLGPLTPNQFRELRDRMPPPIPKGHRAPFNFDPPR